jgi:Transglutaminase-like superfamily
MATVGFRHGTVVAVAWLVVGGFVARCAVAQSLFVIPTDSAPSAIVADDQPLRIALHVRDPATLAKVLGVLPVHTETGMVQFVMSGYPAIQGISANDWLKPTFVVDYREPSVVELSTEYAKTLADAPSPASPLLNKLIKFVANTVHGSHNRGFDVASEVAVHREGDCKQYSVLTVALSRAAGIPARIAIGLVLLRSGITYRAFGHAWAEVQIDGKWVPADAALANTDYPIRYLPFGVLENEGMGYALDLARLTPVWVQRVEVLGDPAGTTSQRAEK